MKVKVIVAQLYPTLCDPARLLCPWNSLGKNIGVGSHSLLEGIFLIQRSNPSLLYCRWILYHLSHQGNPSSHYNLTKLGKTRPHVLLMKIHTTTYNKSLTKKNLSLNQIKPKEVPINVQEI